MLFKEENIIPDHNPSLQGNQGRNSNHWLCHIHSQEQGEGHISSLACLPVLALPSFWVSCLGNVAARNKLGLPLSMINTALPKHAYRTLYNSSLTYSFQVILACVKLTGKTNQCVHTPHLLRGVPFEGIFPKSKQSAAVNPLIAHSLLLFSLQCPLLSSETREKDGRAVWRGRYAADCTQEEAATTSAGSLSAD